MIGYQKNVSFSLETPVLRQVQFDGSGRDLGRDVMVIVLHASILDYHGPQLGQNGLDRRDSQALRVQKTLQTVSDQIESEGGTITTKEGRFKGIPSHLCAVRYLSREMMCRYQRRRQSRRHRGSTGTHVGGPGS